MHIPVHGFDVQHAAGRSQSRPMRSQSKNPLMHVPKSVAQRLVYLPCFFKAQTVVQGFTGNERLRQNEERIWRQLFLVPFGGEELIEVPFNLVIQGVVVYPRQSVVVFVHFYPISIRFNRFFNSIGQFPLLHQWC